MAPKTDKEFKGLIPPLTEDEYKQLEENIISDGCREPLVIWNNILIDGHNRLSICQKHNIEYKTISKEFPNRDEVKAWIIKNQFGRRNLTPYQRGVLVLILKPLISDKAKERQVEAGKRFGKGTQKSAEPIDKTETRDELAKLAGVSHDTISKVEFIKENATEEQKARAIKGGKGNSVNAIYTEVKYDEAVKKGETEKKCTYCGETKDFKDFRVGKNRCKECENEIKCQKGTKPIKKSIKDKYSQLIAESYDDTPVEYTIEHLTEELGLIVESFCENACYCVEEHQNLLNKSENKQKIIAVLKEAETAINKTKESYLI